MPLSKDITPLFSLGHAVSTGYLARAAVNTVLQRGAFSSQNPDDNIEETCRVS
jgi:phosphorylase kinase alpha/beta subunit